MCAFRNALIERICDTFPNLYDELQRGLAAASDMVSHRATSDTQKAFEPDERTLLPKTIPQLKMFCDAPDVLAFSLDFFSLNATS